MKTTVKTPAKRSAKAAVAELRPMVDYPMQDEKILSAEYTFRVGAPDAVDAVEVSINQGEWKACRFSAGYWWYDWAGFDSGEHEVIARAKAKGGRWALSTPHEFYVL